MQLGGCAYTCGVAGKFTVVPHAGECATTCSCALPDACHADSVTSRAMHATSSR